MRNKIITLMLGMMLLIVLTANARADITFWRDISVDTNKSIVKAYGVYNFLDTSPDFLGKYKPIPIAIMYDWDNLPYNISTYYPEYPNAIVDYCNLSIVHYKNEYDSDGNFNGTTLENFYFSVSSASAGQNMTAFYMKHRDTLSISWDCHYTNPDTLFIEGVLFADFGTFFPAFSCSGCEEFKLEELADEISFNTAQAEKEISMYQKLQNIVKLNYNLWLYASWIIKIGMIFGAISLIFIVGFLFYQMINSMARK